MRSENDLYAAIDLDARSRRRVLLRVTSQRPAHLGPPMSIAATLALAVILVALGQAKLSATSSPSTTPTALGTARSATACDDPIKCSPPPPGYTAPLPAPRFPARNPAEVVAGLVQAKFVTLAEGAHYGDAVYVRALRSTDRDEWLVPIVRDGKVGGVVALSAFPDGTAQCCASTGWSGRFPHSLTPEDAMARVTVAGDRATSAELVWSVVDPRSGALANWSLPFYVVRRESGALFYVFQSGDVLPSSALPTASGG